MVPLPRRAPPFGKPEEVLKVEHDVLIIDNALPEDYETHLDRAAC